MNLRRLLTLAALTSLVLLPLAQAQGESETGTVAGVVRADGNPLAGAKVVVSCATDSAYEATAVTDSQGTFTITDVPLGGFAVEVFDTDDVLIAEGQGTLATAWETVNVELDTNPPE